MGYFQVSNDGTLVVFADGRQLELLGKLCGGGRGGEHRTAGRSLIIKALFHGLATGCARFSIRPPRVEAANRYLCLGSQRPDQRRCRPS